MKRAPKAWTEEQLKKCYGDEYPKAVIRGGVRFPLTNERLFSRSFERPDLKHSHIVSRFMDGSAGLSFDELSSEWAAWDEFDRIDFCQNCSWLSGQEDFPDMIRFIMKQGDAGDWAAMAQDIARELPQREAFEFLKQALEKAPPGKRSNLTQGLALTKHPEAGSLLRKHLISTFNDDATWIDDSFLNWIAYDAITCIDHLIELGVQPDELDSHVRRLSEHTCKGNRKSCRQRLSKYYPWLEPEPDQ